MANPPARQTNSQQPIHHDTVQQQSRSRELHPAAAEAMARYTAVWEENDRLHEHNAKLAKENEVLRKVDAEKTALISDLRRTLEESQRSSDIRVNNVETHYRERLAEAERSKERYLRFAVAISERLEACVEDLSSAHKTAMDMASKIPDRALDEIDQAIADVARTVGKD
jgi:hypothetical protein